MKIEVGKKYQDKERVDWWVVVLEEVSVGRFLLLYPSGIKQDLDHITIEKLYKPFEETECAA